MAILVKTPRAAIFYSMKAAGKQIPLLPTSYLPDPIAKVSGH